MMTEVRFRGIPLRDVPWRYELERAKEKAAQAIAWRVPRWLAYWCAIRVVAHATQGPWSTETVPELRAMDAIQRWERAS